MKNNLLDNKMRYGILIVTGSLLFVILIMCSQSGAVFQETEPYFETDTGVIADIDNDGITMTIIFKDGSTISFPTTSVSDDEMHRLEDAWKNGTTVNIFVGDDGLEI